MQNAARIFRSRELQAEFEAAYDEVLSHWPAALEQVDIETKFGSTHVLVSGPNGASPLVLLHPGGGHAPIWIRNVGPLAKEYRVYAVDIVGELNKSRPVAPIRQHSEFMEWMAQLFDGLGIQKATIVGNSNGGFFTLETALYMPERVEKVVLISPAATFVQMWAWWFHLLIPAHMIAPAIRAEGMIFKAYDWLWQGFPMDASFEKLRRISKLAGYRYRPSINSAIPRVMSDAELKKITAPVLLLIGDHEVIYSVPRVIDRARRLIGDLSVNIVPNANHSAQYTAPDFVNAQILGFLEK